MPTWPDDITVERNGSPALHLYSRGNGTQHYTIRATNEADPAGGSLFVIRNESRGRDDLVLGADGVIRAGGSIDVGTYPGSDGSITVRDAANGITIVLDGHAGDIQLANADCAEEFTVAAGAAVEPGTVMVLNNEGFVFQSLSAYDTRVVGVVSGAGGFKPGIVLDRRQDVAGRRPIALMGKVGCLVTAEEVSVRIGDLLTTSDVPGHAMKALDPERAFGAVIGKALAPLATGRGIIPILIGLR